MIHFPRYNPNEQLLMLVIADAATIAANPALFTDPMDYIELPASGTTDPVSVRGAPFLSHALVPLRLKRLPQPKQ